MIVDNAIVELHNDQDLAVAGVDGQTQPAGVARYENLFHRHSSDDRRLKHNLSLFWVSSQARNSADTSTTAPEESLTSSVSSVKFRSNADGPTKSISGWQWSSVSSRP